jgi:hypothetical protein
MHWFVQDVPRVLAAELAEKVPAVFAVKAATKKSKNTLHVNNIREHEFYESLVRFLSSCMHVRPASYNSCCQEYSKATAMHHSAVP